MKRIVLILLALVLGMTVSAQGKKDKDDGKTDNAKIFERGYAKSYLNQKAPELVVREWLTEEPDTVGKFILFEVYGSQCPPCWKAVPKLNEFHAKYKDRMVIIGVNHSKMRLPEEPDADYYKGIDPERLTYKAMKLIFVPWALLIDPNGIVRWEGSPNDLTDEIITKVLKKYKKKTSKK